MAKVEHRTRIVAMAKWGANNKSAIHYEEIRPMPLTNRLPITTDCSGFATLCYYLAGCPDPNGFGYNGSGYTGTLIGHGKEIPLKKVRGGDLVIYGPGTGDHVAVIIDTTIPSNPLAVSHGDENGPTVIRVFDDPRSKRYFQYVTTTG